MASGQYPPRYWQERSALPERHFLSTTEKIYFLQKEDMCTAPPSCTSLILNRKREKQNKTKKPTDSYARKQRQGKTSWTLPSNILCKYDAHHWVIPRLSRGESSFFCHPRHRTQTAYPAMQSGRDGDSNTDFPVDYTEKTINCLQVLSEGLRFFLHQLFIMISAKNQNKQHDSFVMIKSWHIFKACFFYYSKIFIWW